ncbi:MAG: hypothetical protein FJ109_06390 [Deltaproteobacteria bacterium]|nr:hypothetical protein [Deltaproteobacteria bacterium]
MKLSFPVLLSGAAVLLLVSGCSTSPRRPPVDVPETSHGGEIADGTVLDQADGKAGADVRTDVEDVAVDLSPEAVSSEVQALVDQGKYWLSNAEPVLAAKEFEAALALDPTNSDAVFGAAVSRYVAATELLAMVLTLPSQFSGYGAGSGTRSDPESQNDYLAEEVHNIFLFLRSGFLEAESGFSSIQDIGFRFDIEGVPIYVGTRPVVVLRGKFDLADVRLLAGSNAFFLWFTELLAAQDFRSDLLAAAYAGMKAQDEGLDLFTILDVVGHLMASDERFFTLRKDDGHELFAAGMQHMVDAGANLVSGLSLLEELGAEEEADEAISLGWDGGDRLMVVRNRVDGATLDEAPLEIAFSQELIDASQELLDRMQVAGETVPFSQGPAVQLGTLLGFAARLDVLKFMPVEIPIDVSGLQPGQVALLLALMFPDSLGFDYGALAAQPVGLRVLFPLLMKVADPVTAADFWMEWECPAETAANGVPAAAKGFVCSKNAELVDASHFPSTPFEMEPDGYLSPLPYLVWEDPTWGGFLLVDHHFPPMGEGDPEFVIPDLALTNTGLHVWLKQLAGLLQ